MLSVKRKRAPSDASSFAAVTCQIAKLIAGELGKIIARALLLTGRNATSAAADRQTTCIAYAQFAVERAWEQRTGALSTVAVLVRFLRTAPS
jgi:hypothetical protein